MSISYIIEAPGAGYKGIGLRRVLASCAASRVARERGKFFMATPPPKKFNRTPPTIAAVIIALAVLGVGGYFVAQRQEPPMPAAEDLTSDEFDVPKDVEYALPITHIVGGVRNETAPPSLEFPTASGTVSLNVERVFPLETGASYTMFIRGGPTDYEIWIPPNYLEEGTIPVRLDGKVFPPGDYRVEIVQAAADSVKTMVAETVFRITK
jgi:hypothetical protein